MWSNMTGRMEDSATALLTPDSLQVLDSVKAVVHGAACLTTGYFCYLIVVTVRHTQELRSKASFLLLCHHCCCIAAFNAAGCVLHAVRGSRLPAPRLFCWVVFDLQVVAARGAMMNLTLMALNACLSVLQPLRYCALVRCVQRPVLVGVWLLAVLSPLLFTTLSGVRLGWEGLLALEAECSTALEGWAARLSSLVLLALLVLLILLSNVLIALESCRAGHLTRSNRRARRTAMIHALQMSFFLLPSVVIISRVGLGLPARVMNFLLFSVAQSASPVVYGLRCRDLWDHLPRFLPGWALRLRAWYHSWTAGNTTRNRTCTSTENSTGNTTSNSTCTSKENSTGNTTSNSTCTSKENSTGNTTSNSTCTSTENSTGNTTSNSTCTSTDNSTGNTTSNSTCTSTENSTGNSTCNNTGNSTGNSTENSTCNNTGNSTENSTENSRGNQ